MILVDPGQLICLVPNNQGLFLHLVLDKAKGTLALARYKLTDVERSRMRWILMTSTTWLGCTPRWITW